MNLHQFLKKIKNKPEETKIKILWSIVIPIGIILFFLWINIAKNSISNISGSIKNLEIDKNLVITEEIERDVEKLKLFLSEEELNHILEEITSEEELKKIIEELEKEENQKIILEENIIEPEK